MHLSRVRNNHATDKWCDRLGYCMGIARCLDHDVILRRQLGGERCQMIPLHIDTTQPHQPVAIDHHRLGESAMDVHANNPHH
jgi:hypothetical protein